MFMAYVSIGKISISSDPRSASRARAAHRRIAVPFSTSCFSLGPLDDYNDPHFLFHTMPSLSAHQSPLLYLLASITRIFSPYFGPEPLPLDLRPALPHVTALRLRNSNPRFLQSDFISLAFSRGPKIYGLRTESWLIAGLGSG